MTRLFTSGTHNGLTFSNADIASILEKSKNTQTIPFVLGHPKNNLPVVGVLSGKNLKRFTEGEKHSIGFDRNDAEFSEESMEAIRALKHNKISIRLVNGAINHIGLVKKAAVAENNAQDFADGNGDFSAIDDFESEKPLIDRISDFCNPFKTKKTMTEEQLAAENAALRQRLSALEANEKEAKSTAEFEALKADNEALKKEKSQREAADFNAKIDALKLPEAQAKQAKDFAAPLLAAGKQNELLEFIAKLANTARVVNGSVVNAEFAEGKQAKVSELLGQQINQFKNNKS